MSDNLNNFGYCKKHNAYFDKDIRYCIFCKIEALEKDVRKWKRRTIQDYFKMSKVLIRVRKNKEQIAELKEKEYLNAGEIRNNKQDFHELREVLREFLVFRNEWIEDIFRKNIDQYILTKAQKWHLVKAHIFFKGLLEKLDSKVGSARQTEKKEPHRDCCNCGNNNSESFICDGCDSNYSLWKPMKESGGEKPLPNGSDVGLTRDQGIDRPKDSKPPETEPVGIVRKIEGDIATVELYPPTITDTNGTIWIHPKILEASLIEGFLEDLGWIKGDMVNALSRINIIIKAYKGRIK